MGGGYPNLGIVVDFIIRSLDLSRLFLFYMKKFSHFNKFSNAQNIKRAGLAPARQPVDKTLVLRPNRPFPVEKVFPGGSARSVRLKGKTFNLKAYGGFISPSPFLTSPRRAINPLADKRRPSPFVASLTGRPCACPSS